MVPEDLFGSLVQKNNFLIHNKYEEIFGDKNVMNNASHSWGENV